MLCSYIALLLCAFGTLGTHSVYSKLFVLSALSIPIVLSVFPVLSTFSVLSILSMFFVHSTLCMFWCSMYALCAAFSCHCGNGNVLGSTKRTRTPRAASLLSKPGCCSVKIDSSSSIQCAKHQKVSTSSWKTWRRTETRSLMPWT